METHLKKTDDNTIDWGETIYDAGTAQWGCCGYIDSCRTFIVFADGADGAWAQDFGYQTLFTSNTEDVRLDIEIVKDCCQKYASAMVFEEGKPVGSKRYAHLD